ncbi:PrsW family intramembrane metalloprotease [Sphaerimonospora mesophila]|uniref:PrsW family intramembrane metalloprotease n=1 Tax=Sphaerimonospora mesophila TaxID=37483 RepID=UPI0006E385F4
MASLDPRAVLKERPSMGLISGLVVAGLCALVSFSFDVLDGDPVQFSIALVLAVAPVPLLLAGVLALDRMEPEPRTNLIFAFAWGAGVAVLVAGLLNSLNLLWLQRWLGQGAHDLVATFGAPPVEETMKGIVLLGLLWFRRQELDGPTDGIIYASMVGLGFAMSENVSYYITALSENGPEVLAATVVVRGVLSPFAHPLFTSLIGISVAYAAAQRRSASGVAVIVAGWIGAMIMHGIWNGFALFGGLGGLAIAYLLLMILLIIELIVVFRDRRRIVGLINHYLPPYEAHGLINQADIFMLSSLKGRRQARLWAKAHGGRAGVRAMTDYQLAATELGLLHARAARGGVEEPAFRAAQRSLVDLMAYARMSFPLPDRHRPGAARGVPPPGYASGYGTTNRWSPPPPPPGRAPHPPGQEPPPDV